MRLCVCVYTHLYTSLVDPDVPPLSTLHWVIVTAAIAATIALEAFTRQIDNLVLGAYLFALLIALM